MTFGDKIDVAARSRACHVKLEDRRLEAHSKLSRLVEQSPGIVLPPVINDPFRLDNIAEPVLR